MAKKIIVEGIDGAGKSTFIRKYIEEHPDDNFKMVHCTRHTPNTYDYFKELLLSDENIIFDRAMYGQFVYQTSRQRLERNQLDLEDLLRLEVLMYNIDAKVYYVYSDLDVCLYNCQKDEEDSYYTLDYLKELDIRFRQIFNMSIVEVNYYYNDYHPQIEDAEEVNYRNFDYNSLPKIVAVDFDGTLVTGAEFPEIGTLNQKLVDMLYKGKYKDYKKILFTHRCGDNLIDACNFCADNGIYFDAVNDDIPEVKKILNRNPVDNRKIWFDILFDDKANPDKFLD